MTYPKVTLKTGKGTVEMELYPDVAPNTVNNFISLVKKGFYNKTKFHRIIPHFMIQGGDPQGTGMGGPGYSIRGEFSSNRFKNELKHTRGVVSMARAVNPNSAGSSSSLWWKTPLIWTANMRHLEKSSAGWRKSTALYPSRAITTTNHWKTRSSNPQLWKPSERITPSR